MIFEVMCEECKESFVMVGSNTDIFDKCQVCNSKDKIKIKELTKDELDNKINNSIPELESIKQMYNRVLTYDELTKEYFVVSRLGDYVLCETEDEDLVQFRVITNSNTELYCL